jgi:hypothetical protein
VHLVGRHLRGHARALENRRDRVGGSEVQHEAPPGPCVGGGVERCRVARELLLDRGDIPVEQPCVDEVADRRRELARRGVGAGEQRRHHRVLAPLLG